MESYYVYNIDPYILTIEQ